MKTEQRSFPEQTAQGLDKVTRYTLTVRNAPGEFLMIPKGELEVDPAYQRNKINQRRVDALTRHVGLDRVRRPGGGVAR